MTETHSPLPWSLVDDNTFSDLGDKRIRAANGISPGIVFGGISEAAANAEFIVRACNSHYELLSALKACRDAMEDGSPFRNADAFRLANLVIAQAEGAL